MIVQLEGATACRGNKVVIDDVSVALQSGQLLAILGPNGAGKSSLLKLLSNDLDLTSGSLKIAGQDMSYWRQQRQLLAQQRAVMPQFHALNFAFSAYEVVQLGRLPYTQQRASMNDYAIAQAMAAAGVTSLAGEPYTRLSGGQQARVQFARVIAQLLTEEGDLPRGKLLLLDEPTASLDLRYQHELLKFSQVLCQHGNAVALVLHDLNLAARYASHLLLMKHGRQLAYGTVDQVFQSDVLSHCYDFDVTVHRGVVTDRPLAVS